MISLSEDEKSSCTAGLAYGASLTVDSELSESLMVND
jgi:hypothetical protein